MCQDSDNKRPQERGKITNGHRLNVVVFRSRRVHRRRGHVRKKSEYLDESSLLVYAILLEGNGRVRSSLAPTMNHNLNN